MNDTNNPGEKPANKTLTLKRPIEQGTVRQSFSHGRSKTVVVEHVKRRQHGEPAKAPAAAPPAPVSAAPAAPVQA
ncbi:translation initiation factor IF-2 associated domain-containing protein, partial [Rhodoblastus sphagnicola]